MRLHPRGIEPAGTDGYVLTTIGGEALWAPASGGGSGTGTLYDAKGDILVATADDTPARLAVGADGQVLTADSTAPAGVSWQAVSSSGGVSSGGAILLENGQSVTDYETANGVTVAPRTIVFQKAPTSTTWSFAGLSALPSGWTRRGVTSETFAADGMQFTPAAGQGYQTPIPNGFTGDFTIEVELLSGSTSRMQGAIAATASGAGYATVAFNNPSGGLITNVTNWQYGSSFANSGGTPTYPMRLRLRKGGSTYYGSMSTDAGATWTADKSFAGSATALDNIGFGDTFGSATMKVSYLKWTPAGASGLMGWWDGAEIVPF